MSACSGKSNVDAKKVAAYEIYNLEGFGCAGVEGGCPAAPLPSRQAAEPPSLPASRLPGFQASQPPSL